MVAIEEIVSEEAEGSSAVDMVEEVSVSEERRLDAIAIEEAAVKMARVSARLQLESLAKRLRKDSEALARVEQSRGNKMTTSNNSSSRSSNNNVEQPKTGVVCEEGKKTPTSPSPAAVEAKTTPTAETAPQPPSPTTTTTVAPPRIARYTSIDKFAFDAGGYDSHFVTLYIDLPGVGSIPRGQITCNFTKESFDLIVLDLKNKSYRLFKDNLEKDIDPDKSKIIVKKERILVKLAKVKQGEYGGYDYWSQLTAKKSKKDKKASESNPQASIMELMKDMYDQGDDNMKKVIGETMMKQQRGELGKDKTMGGGLDPGAFGGDDDDF